RRRLESRPVARPLQAERQVHVLEVGPERLREGPHPQQRLAPVERARRARPEHRPRAPVFLPRPLALAALGRHPAEAIAGAAAGPAPASTPRARRPPRPPGPRSTPAPRPPSRRSPPRRR